MCSVLIIYIVVVGGHSAGIYFSGSQQKSIQYCVDNIYEKVM